MAGLMMTIVLSVTKPDIQKKISFLSGGESEFMLRFLTRSQVFFPFWEQSCSGCYPCGYTNPLIPDSSTPARFPGYLVSSMTLPLLSPSSALIYLKIPCHFCLLHLGQSSGFILKISKMWSQPITFYVSLFPIPSPPLKSGWLFSKHTPNLFLGVCSLNWKALFPSKT